MIVMMWTLEREKSEKREGENMRGFERICSFVVLGLYGKKG